MVTAVAFGLVGLLTTSCGLLDFGMPDVEELIDALGDSEADEETGEATAAPETDAVVDEGPPRPDLGLPEVTLTTPPSGLGPRPVLEWEPVGDAHAYAVTVYAGPGGPASWSWRGTETQVRVGFVDDPTVGGPNVIAGMTWAVIALDGDGEPIAQSGERPIGH